MATRGPVATPALERMIPKIDFADGCWMWNAGRDANGYGRFSVGSRVDGTRRNTYAHIAVWEEVVGPVPKDLVLDHLCENTSCVNPDHLEPKTKGENTLRSSIAPAAINARKTECVNGHPYNEGNTRRLTDGTRACRTCGREAMRRWREAQDRR